MFDSDAGPVYDDLEILEEYLNGELLPPLDLAAPVDASWGEEHDATTMFVDEAASTEPPVAEPAATFTTSTMAEIYVSQGFIQRAIDIYEEMLTESPLNEGIIQRLSELQDLLKTTPTPEDQVAAAVADHEPETAAAPEGGGDVVATLEKWLDNINRRR